jgi:uncharacterized protein YhdP
VTEASGRQLSLQTRDGLTLAPMDFFLRLDAPAARRRPGRVRRQPARSVGAVAAGRRLPFDPAFRARLAALAPAGQVAPANVKWTVGVGRLASYAVDARFSRLGIAPVGAWPGFSGLSGRIEGNEKGGRFSLSGRDASLDLPQIFPAPRLALAELAADGSWSHPDGVLEVTLASASFANRDTRGSAAGRYRASRDTPGEIDLQARLTEADARAVWRYMPAVVGKAARDWLEHSLAGGKAEDARLVLKGDLAKFPFRNPKDGTFRVTARVTDGLLDYARAGRRSRASPASCSSRAPGCASRPTAGASSAPS